MSLHLLIVSSIFLFLTFATDDDILDTSIYGITFDWKFSLFAARDGTSIFRAVCKLCGRRNCCMRCAGLHRLAGVPAW